MKHFLTLIVFLTIHFVTHAQSSLIGTWRPIKITESNNNQIFAHIDDVKKKEVSKNSQYGDLKLNVDSTFSVCADTSIGFSKATDWYKVKYPYNLNYGDWHFESKDLWLCVTTTISKEQRIYEYEIKKLSPTELEISYHLHDKKGKTIIHFKRIS